jgi:formylglycine-generating enzyme
MANVDSIDAPAAAPAQSSPVRASTWTDMVWIPGGECLMGSSSHYPEEWPAHRMHVDGFWIDRCPVTNARFAEFVADTGYLTVAELAPNAEDYPGALPELLRPGSLVFAKPQHAVDTRHVGNWWAFLLGADWRHPQGADSSLDGLENHPVVHVAYADVEAYAAWAGKRLPTEAEWEAAARGGLHGAVYAWGNELLPDGNFMANTWQGRFPYENLCEDGYEGTSPVTAFPPNGYGVQDMIGNVWEWTSDWYRPWHARSRSACCAPDDPRMQALESCDPAGPFIRIPRKVLKGGSHLCAPNYCRRYRPAARHPHPIDTATSHIGFRCVMTLPSLEASQPDDRA